MVERKLLVNEDGRSGRNMPVKSFFSSLLVLPVTVQANASMATVS